jgi:hypothetical protein
LGLIVDDVTWAEFERRILEVAATFAELKKCEGDHRPLHEVVRDLKAIDQSLTVVLQRLIALAG